MRFKLMAGVMQRVNCPSGRSIIFTKDQVVPIDDSSKIDIEYLKSLSFLESMDSKKEKDIPEKVEDIEPTKDAEPKVDESKVDESKADEPKAEKKGFLGGGRKSAKQTSKKKKR